MILVCRWLCGALVECASYRGGFISHYLLKVIYPPGLTHGMQIGLGVLLLLVAIIGYWGFLRRHVASA